MREIQHSTHIAKVALVKLSFAVLFLICLIIVCFSGIDHSLRGAVAAFLFALVIPINILLSIDASRAIRCEPNLDKKTKIIGAILGIPQAILGLTLMGVGVAYPFIGLRNIVNDLSTSSPTILDMVWTIMSLIMIVLGYLYLRESLGLIGYKRRSSGSK